MCEDDMYCPATKLLDPHLHASVLDLQKFAPYTVIDVGACKLMLGSNEINSISPVTQKSMKDSLRPNVSWFTYNRTEVPEVSSLSSFGVMHRNVELLITVAKALFLSPKKHDMFEPKKCEPTISTSVLPLIAPIVGYEVMITGFVKISYLTLHVLELHFRILTSAQPDF